MLFLLIVLGIVAFIAVMIARSIHNEHQETIARMNEVMSEPSQTAFKTLPTPVHGTGVRYVPDTPTSHPYRDMVPVPSISPRQATYTKTPVPVMPSKVVYQTDGFSYRKTYSKFCIIPGCQNRSAYHSDYCSEDCKLKSYKATKRYGYDNTGYSSHTTNVNVVVVNDGMIDESIAENLVDAAVLTKEILDDVHEPLKEATQLLESAAETTYSVAEHMAESTYETAASVFNTVSDTTSSVFDTASDAMSDVFSAASSFFDD